MSEQQSSAVSAEPVAWRWKVSPMQLNWQYSDAPPATSPVYNLELLYRDPPQSALDDTAFTDAVRAKLPRYVSNRARSLALDALDDVDKEHREAKAYALARWFAAILASCGHCQAESDK
jgi:hypothetical protein